MKAIWIVRWRGLEEEYRCPQDAMDRFEQLDARGIETEVFEQRAGERRPVRW